MASTTNLKQLKINVLTEEQYSNAEINEDELYMIPEIGEEFVNIMISDISPHNIPNLSPGTIYIYAPDLNS